MSQPISGVYLIRCLPTGKVYVGSSVNIKNRWNLHRKQLVNGDHPNRYLLAAWNKHGREAFAWEVIEGVDPSQLVEREQHFIESFQSNKRDRGFNLRRFAHSNLGMKMPSRVSSKKGIPLAAETRAKMREAAARRTPEQKAEIARKQAERRSNRSQETKNRIYETVSKKLRGRPTGRSSRNPSPETRAKLSAAATGKTPTPETRAKLSAVGKTLYAIYGNNKAFRSPESQAKAAAARKGKPLSIRNRESITLAMRRLHSSPERLQAKQDRLQAKEQAKERARLKRQEEKRLKKEEKDWERSVKRCINRAKFLSPEAQAKRTEGVRRAYQSGKFQLTPEARARMSEGARKAALNKKANPRQQ